ncbi:hypothetical protein AI46_27005 [Burkholderia multivorans R-20526]|nr:hypothetical protein AI46_27005 [Burkholderia multivorans R-20526]
MCLRRSSSLSLTLLVPTSTVAALQRGVLVVVSGNPPICVFLTNAEIIVELHFDDGSNVRLYRWLRRVVHDHDIWSARLYLSGLLPLQVAGHLAWPTVADIVQQVVVRYQRIGVGHDR